MNMSFVDNSPHPPTPAEALQPRYVAAANFKHVYARLRIKDMPTLHDIYLGSAASGYAPPDLDLHVLFEHFNDIARANSVAHPSLNVVQNGLIFYYAIDKAHSFIFRREQTRHNIVPAIFVWVSMLSEEYDQRFDASKELWSKYIMAWMESVLPGTAFPIGRPLSSVGNHQNTTCNDSARNTKTSW
jgi:hypothetical protein